MEAVIKGERLDTLQRIELAEGVNIRLRVAGLPVRLLAFAIDYLICATIMIVAVVVGSILGVGTQSSGVIGLLILVWFVVRWFYHLPFEVGKRGATPGKRAMKIRVVSGTGAPVSLGQSVVRNLLRFVDEMPAFIATVPLVPTYMFGAAAIVCGRRFQRLGDLAAGTIVVYTGEQVLRVPQNAPPALPARPTAPRCPLHREELLAFVRYRERLPLWSEARRIELANHLEPLTGKSGAEGVRETLGIAAWIDKAK